MTDNVHVLRLAFLFIFPISVLPSVCTWKAGIGMKRTCTCHSQDNSFLGTSRKYRLDQGTHNWTNKKYQKVHLIINISHVICLTPWKLGFPAKKKAKKLSQMGCSLWNSENAFIYSSPQQRIPPCQMRRKRTHEALREGKVGAILWQESNVTLSMYSCMLTYYLFFENFRIVYLFIFLQVLCSSVSLSHLFFERDI